MSEPIATPPTGDIPPVEEGELLQFDQAEFAAPATEWPTCTVCHQPIPDEYYEVNQRVMCPRCRQGIEVALRGGSPAARFLKATVLGILAAVAGAVIYYMFVRATATNWALIAIVVGLMVGGAVRKGTGNRGGRIYQLLAVFLTYSSIVGMYVLPFLVETVLKDGPEKPAAKVAAEKGQPKAKEGAPADGPEAKEKADPQGQPAAPPPASSLLVGLAVLIGLFYAFPVLQATQAPISGLIYAFALWEAWKINKPFRIEFNGPFRLAAAVPAPEEVVDES